MSNAPTAERRELHRMIRSLPDDKIASATDYIRFLAGNGEPPLTGDELAQIEEAECDLTEGRVYSLDEFNRRMDALR